MCFDNDADDFGFDPSQFDPVSAAALRLIQGIVGRLQAAMEAEAAQWDDDPSPYAGDDDSDPDFFDDGDDFDEEDIDDDYDYDAGYDE